MAGHGPDMSKEIVQGIFGALAMIVVCATIGGLIASSLPHEEHAPADPQRVENPQATTGADVPATPGQVKGEVADPAPANAPGDGAADQEPGVGSPPPSAIAPPTAAPAPEVPNPPGDPT